MTRSLKVLIAGESSGALLHSGTEFVFNYSVECAVENFVSLTMPVRAKSYVYHQLHPIFEMHLPEGYLLSILKKHFSKITDTDDFGLLALLSPSVRGRIQYDSNKQVAKAPLHLEDLLRPASAGLFNELVSRFALSSPLSGVQPKVLAQVENKATFKLEDYIVKAWGEEYPELALNEFLCMQAVKSAGISVPDFYLSNDDQLFIMKRFDIAEDGCVLGFEDLCVLQAKQRDDKYQGSYEKVAKSLLLFTSRHFRAASIEQFFKMMVMNNLLQNGDAHLKNFGVLYRDINEVQISPAYDVVSTTAYIQNDIPALTLLGSKRWHGKEKLIQFAVDACQLSKRQALSLYNECLLGMQALEKLVVERLENETVENKRHVLLHLKKLTKEARITAE